MRFDLFLFLFFVKRVHDQVVHSLQLSLILDGGEDALAVLFHSLQNADLQLFLIAGAGGGFRRNGG